MQRQAMLRATVAICGMHGTRRMPERHPPRAAFREALAGPCCDAQLVICKRALDGPGPTEEAQQAQHVCTINPAEVRVRVAWDGSPCVGPTVAWCFCHWPSLHACGGTLGAHSLPSSRSAV